MTAAQLIGAFVAPAMVARFAPCVNISNPAQVRGIIARLASLSLAFTYWQGYEGLMWIRIFHSGTGERQP